MHATWDIWNKLVGTYVFCVCFFFKLKSCVLYKSIWYHNILIYIYIYIYVSCITVYYCIIFWRSNCINFYEILFFITREFYLLIFLSFIHKLIHHSQCSIYFAFPSFSLQLFGTKDQCLFHDHDPKTIPPNVELGS